MNFFTFEFKLKFFYVLPFLLLAVAIILFILATRVGKFKDRYKYNRVQVKEDDNLSIGGRLKIKLKKYSKLQLSLFLLGIAAAFIIYGFLAPVAHIWYVHIEVIIISVLMPIVFLLIASNKKKDTINQFLPAYFQHIIDGMTAKNSIVPALRVAKDKTYSLKLSEATEKLADNLERNKVNKGLENYYKSLDENIYIYQFTKILNNYLKSGGDMVGILQRQKDNVTRYVLIRQNRSKPMLVAKILALLSIIGVPASIKFNLYISMGYLSEYYASIAGQNMVAFTLLYSIISFLFLYIIERN